MLPIDVKSTLMNINFSQVVIFLLVLSSLYILTSFHDTFIVYVYPIGFLLYTDLFWVAHFILCVKHN